jgi:hypothetical protein
MSKRVAGIALLLGLFAAAQASAEMPADESHRAANDLVISFDDSDWELFRPRHRVYEDVDLAYMTDILRLKFSGYGLRFRSSPHLTFDLQVDILGLTDDQFDPIYDVMSGAAIFSVGFHF